MNVLSVIVVVVRFILFCYFVYNNVYCLFFLFLCLSLWYMLVCFLVYCVFFMFLMAASFDGPRPLLVACHWQFCSLANKLRSFVRSFIPL